MTPQQIAAKEKWDDTVGITTGATFGAISTLALGVVSPDAAFSSMLTTFALSGVAGYYVVWGNKK